MPSTPLAARILEFLAAAKRSQAHNEMLKAKQAKHKGGLMDDGARAATAFGSIRNAWHASAPNPDRIQAVAHGTDPRGPNHCAPSQG